MMITKIEPASKTKFKIYVDEEFAFILYKGELSRFRLKEQGEISEETISQIKSEILVKRAKLRAMHLLNEMARTEAQLRQKLRQNGYPEDVIETAINYVKSFGYINDETYIRNFVESRKEKKSRREIYALLSQKGLNQEMVESVLNEVYEGYSEQEAIREIMRKKRWNPETADGKELQRIYASLVRKGFRYEDIRQVIQV